MGSEKVANGFFVRNRAVFSLSLSAIMLAATFDLFAGLIMVGMSDYLMIVPGLMILIYSANGLRGNVFGAMGSRIGTAMHLGTFNFSFKKNSVLRSNVEGAMSLTMITSVIVGIVGWIIGAAFFSSQSPVGILMFMFISMMGSLLAGLMVVIINIAIAYIGFKRDWDVDNITAPLIAAAGDVATVPTIFLAVWMCLNLDGAVVYICLAGLLALTFGMTGAILMRKNKRKKRNEAKRIIVESLPVLTICIFIGLLAGTIVETQTAKLVAYPVLLVLLPAFLNQGNALSGILTCRFSTMMHMGTLSVKKYPPIEAYNNFAVTYVLGLITFAYVGVAAFLMAPQTMPFYEVMLLVLVAGMLSTTVINLLSYYVASAAVRFGLNPDDQSIPVTSSTMDVASASIFISLIRLTIL
ncbi:MAG: Mg/Co/Ni transporter MgtE [Thermoplasmatales archaeon]|nr:Mg/Co/Ni transporter MgtE [Thermoplasmatales archaeon]